MEKKNTIFCDIDGTIFKYRKFGTYEETLPEVIQSTLDYLNEEKSKGSYIVLTTARPDMLHAHTIKELIRCKVPFDRLLTGIERGVRYLINDMDPEKEGERAVAINLVRDQGFTE
jgi:ribonucleotide monophosphatase NagD (HAD superfamily)